VTNGTYTTLYAHLEDPGLGYDPSIKGCLSGDNAIRQWHVRRGDYLGRTGMTGTTSGLHSHYEIRKGGSVCPASYMDYSHPACAAGGFGLNQVSDSAVDKIQSLIQLINPFSATNNGEGKETPDYDFSVEGSKE